jgi:hypothetical protein
MKFPLVLSCCLATLIAPALAASDASDSVRTPPLTGGDCLDSNRIRGWTAVDDRLILVEDVRHKYRVEVAPGCQALKFTHSVAFKGDPTFGRVCGLGDEIVTKDYPCAIERMELLTDAQYKQAKDNYRAERKARKEAGKSKQP